MPRFFIDTDDGDFAHEDREGHELPGLREARRAALGALPGMADDKLPDGDRRRFVATVRDERGTVVYTSTLTLEGEWHVPPPPGWARDPDESTPLR